MKNLSEISRRDLLKNAGAAAAIGTLGASGVSALSQAPATQTAGRAGGPRTLALIGDRYHNPDYTRICLDRLFGELSLPIHYTANYDKLSRSMLEPYQLFICFRDNMIWPQGYIGPDQWISAGDLENPGDFPREQPEDWLTEDQGNAVKEFVAAGNGFYSFHNSALVSNSQPSYRDVQGGSIVYDPPTFRNGYPPVRPFKVRIVNKDHPVTKGVEDFMVTDEQFFTVYDKDPKNILIHSENLDGLSYAPGYGARQGGGGGGGRPNQGVPGSQSAAGRQGVSGNQATSEPPPHTLGTVSISGWAHEYGKGRVVYTGMGGTLHAMWQPEHLKLQKNAVRWLLKMS